MLLKTLWVTVLLCSLQQFLYSQIGGYTLNGGIHYKYWHYRQKLISDFLVIGNEDPLTCQFTKGTSKFGGSGLSIPACWRYETSDPTLNHYNWGDGTGELGWYIGVLATELRLLYNYNQDYTSTQYELYCALKAYERLDRSCEAIAYPFTSTTRCNTINGMFVRDDVDATLMDQHIAFKAKIQ